MKRFAVLLALASSSACTHRAAPVIEPSACTWDTCSLFLGGQSIYRGVERELIAKINAPSPAPLAPYIAGNDLALLQYQAYRDAHTRSQWALVGFTAASTVAFPYAIACAFGKCNGARAALIVTATGLSVLASRATTSTRRQLSRLVWQYNRHLPPHTDSLRRD